jgi:hypothetical protein
LRTRTLQAQATGGRRGRGIAGVSCLLALVVLAGCRQDMHQAPRYDPLERSDFFADQRASRPLVEGVVARGFLREDRLFYTGKDGDRFADVIPVPVTRTCSSAARSASTSTARRATGRPATARA